MRFRCVPCDELMEFQRAEGPAGGPLTALFACPRCGRAMAMLANAKETQLVQALGLQVGAAAVAAADAAAGTPGAAGPGAASPGATRTAPAAAAAGGGSPAPPATGPAGGPVVWSAEADERLRRIPAFVRPMAVQAIEEFARRRGLALVTVEVMDEVKQAYGM